LNVFVDTSVWSLALRRDTQPPSPEVEFLTRALDTGEPVFTTGIVLQELLQGFAGPKAGPKIIKRFATLPFLVPDRDDYIDAAKLHNGCRRRGVAIATIDALLARLCIRHKLTMLTTDDDFTRIAEAESLSVWDKA
jgi:hypothetical protein